MTQEQYSNRSLIWLYSVIRNSNVRKIIRNTFTGRKWKMALEWMQILTVTCINNLSLQQYFSYSKFYISIDWWSCEGYDSLNIAPHIHTQWKTYIWMYVVHDWRDRLSTWKGENDEIVQAFSTNKPCAYNSRNPDENDTAKVQVRLSGKPL